MYTKLSKMSDISVQCKMLSYWSINQNFGNWIVEWMGSSVKPYVWNGFEYISKTQIKNK